MNVTLYVSAKVAGQDVDIKFQDKEYTNSIVLAVKNIGKDLIPFLWSN